jgi:hypothetical protein
MTQSFRLSTSERCGSIFAAMSHGDSVDGAIREVRQATRPVSSVERSLLALGVLLRLYLAIVNAEANDDHQTVIRIIAEQHRLPGLREAWEGFQPKLYHVTVAILWNLSPWQSSVVQVRIAQLVACAAGTATLFVVRRALARWALSAPTRILTFALVALNPTLIGLNAQATNDSFVILFATVALFHAYEFFRVGTIRAFILMSISVVLATLSKGNGLVVFIAISATLAHAIVRHDALPRFPRRQLVGVTAGFVLMFLASTVLFGSYRRNWEDTGNPFSINGDRAPLPHVFNRTYVYRPGTTSIADTYFTFRFVDMLAHPTITTDPRVYPLHRTSLWSQLYGRANVAHFAQHPPSWRNTCTLVFATSRLILVIALLPTALLLAGMLRIVGTLTRPSRRRSFLRRQNLNWELTALTAIGFVAFIVMYSLLYRDFSTMKAEFLFPGLLAFAVLFADEAERAQASYLRERWIRCGVGWAFAVLLALYVTDVVILAIQLT